MSIVGNLLANGAYYKQARADYAGAKEMYERALKKGVTKPERIATYGVLLMREGNFEKAIEMYNKAIGLKPDKVNRIKIRLNRAIAFAKAGRLKEGKVALEDIHEKYRSVRVYEALGYFYVLSDDEKAEEYNLEAYEYDSENYVILDNLCQYYLMKNDYEKAKSYGSKAYKVNDNKVDNLYHLAIIYAHNKDLDKAKVFCQDMMKAPLTALNNVTEELRLETYKNIIGKDYDPDEFII